VSGERRTVEGAYRKIESHEEICAIRYEGINASLVKLEKLIWSVLLSIAGFLAVTLVAVVLHALKLA
jgi:hypothetical protein